MSQHFPARVVLSYMRQTFNLHKRWQAIPLYTTFAVSTHLNSLRVV
jgi:hypothetical protein